jgi:hypothetical protein
VPVRAGGPVLTVDGQQRVGAEVVVTGWAATADHRPVDAVLAFAGRRLVAAAPPTVRRPDVARVLGRDEEGYGFRLALRPQDAHRLSVVALAGDRAGPPAPTCGPPTPAVEGC